MLIQNPLNAHTSAFPLLEVVHLAGIACGVGTAMVVNLRLLGVGLTQRSSSELWHDARPWTLTGLAVAIFSGLFLFSIDPEMYWANDIFRMKMVALAAALVFYYTMVRRAAASKGGGKLAALVSLALWALVPFGGIFIGFFDAGAGAKP